MRLTRIDRMISVIKPKVTSVVVGANSSVQSQDWVTRKIAHRWPAKDPDRNSKMRTVFLCFQVKCLISAP